MELRDRRLRNARWLAALLRPKLQRDVRENLEETRKTTAEMQGEKRYVHVRRGPGVLSYSFDDPFPILSLS